jgi:YgiT-type zinc finger domain-containing protein
MNSNLVPSSEVRDCAECDHAARLSFQQQKFIYGIGSDAVELSACVPVWTCENCGFAFTDGDAEDARQNAVCKYLGS